MTIRDILEKKTAKETAEWANRTFLQKIQSCEIDFTTIEGMKRITEMMSEDVANYAYLVNILSYLKVYTRQAKAEKDRERANDLIDKKEIIQNALDAVKMHYNTLSRMITIRQEINREIQMSSHME